MSRVRRRGEAHDPVVLGRGEVGVEEVLGCREAEQTALAGGGHPGNGPDLARLSGNRLGEFEDPPRVAFADERDVAGECDRPRGGESLDDGLRFGDVRGPAEAVGSAEVEPSAGADSGPYPRSEFGVVQADRTRVRAVASAAHRVGAVPPERERVLLSAPVRGGVVEVRNRVVEMRGRGDADEGAIAGPFPGGRNTIVADDPTAGRDPASRRKSRPDPLVRTAHIVGMTGFEPATLCSQNRCATKSRHIPRRNQSNHTRTASAQCPRRWVRHVTKVRFGGW